jgi:hypothetical protein
MRINDDCVVMVGDSRILKGHALGNVKLPVIGKSGTVTDVTFTDVLYVPLLSTKLISERLLRSKKVFYSGEEFALYNRDSANNAVIVNAHLCSYYNSMRPLPTDQTLNKSERPYRKSWATLCKSD